MLGVSLLLAVIYTYIFHKHFDTNLTILAVLVPILNVAFVLMGLAKSPDEAVTALKFTYTGGCFLIVSAMFLIFNTCGIHLNKWIKAGCILVSAAVFVTVLTIGHSNIFYVGMPEIASYAGASYITNKHYGFMHTVFYVIVILYYVATVSAIVYSFFKQKQVPRRVLILLSIAVSVAVIGFFGGRFITNKVELLPLTYNIGMIIYLILASRLRLYDATDSVIDSVAQKGDVGFVSFDSRLNYLGSNETAKVMIPEISEYKVDKCVRHFDIASSQIIPMIEKYRNDNKEDKQYLELGKKIFLLRINKLSVGRFYHGYQLLISDDTINQEHIKLIKNYNAQLEAEVAKKTKNIQEIHNKMVLGMATMVEGRDNSTGGHIKRTSDCMKLLIDVMRKEGYPGLTDQFCDNIVRAAPMHDLGKIAVDDAVLRKPGRFTPEEFEKMKAHTSEGARIVHKILEGTDNEEFARIAENVAHYHHERWDGSGYPTGLAGNKIPLEARIMAIVDVYDALVSKRVYKDSMSFEDANKIIMDGMGKQFDKSLEPYYIKARPLFEKYYSKLEN